MLKNLQNYLQVLFGLIKPKDCPEEQKVLADQLELELVDSFIENFKKDHRRPIVQLLGCRSEIRIMSKTEIPPT